MRRTKFEVDERKRKKIGTEFKGIYDYTRKRVRLVAQNANRGNLQMTWFDHFLNNNIYQQMLYTAALLFDAEELPNFPELGEQIWAEENLMAQCSD